MYIDFDIENQKIRRTDNNIVAANSQNAVKARFSFDKSWENLCKKANFEFKNKVLRVALENDECFIPFEALSEGFFDLGVIATKAEGEGFRATSNMVSVEVARGPRLEAENAPEPTPLEIERIEGIAQSLRDDANSGKFDGKVGATPEISVGVVTTLAPGEAASVEISGTSEKPVLNIGIPQGKTGLDGRSLYAVGSLSELLNRIKVEVDNVAQNSATIHIIWIGEETVLTTTDGTGHTLSSGNCYKVTGIYINPANVDYTGIEKTATINGDISEEQIAKGIEDYFEKNPVEGGKGEDGFSPIVDVTPISGGHRVTVTDADNTESFDVMNGADGATGPKGDDGYTPIKGIDYFDGKDGAQGAPGEKGDKGDTGATPNLTIGSVTTLYAGDKATAYIEGTPENPKLHLIIPRGANGEDGTSVTITKTEPTTQSGGVNKIYFSNDEVLGIRNGYDGVDGKDGVSASHSWSGTTLTVTSASGTSSANLKGDKGDKGDTGPAYTLTDADKEAIVNAVIAGIPTTEGVEY